MVHGGTFLYFLRLLFNYIPCLHRIRLRTFTQPLQRGRLEGGGEGSGECSRTVKKHDINRNRKGIDDVIFHSLFTICKFSFAIKYFHAYITNVVIKSHLGGGGNGLVWLCSTMQHTIHIIPFFLFDFWQFLDLVFTQYWKTKMTDTSVKAFAI